MDMDIQHIPETVIAACVLHYVCLIDGEDTEKFLEPTEEVEVNNFQNVLRREQLIQQLHLERSYCYVCRTRQGWLNF